MSTLFAMPTSFLVQDYEASPDVDWHSQIQKARDLDDYYFQDHDSPFDPLNALFTKKKDRQAALQAGFEELSNFIRSPSCVDWIKVNNFRPNHQGRFLRQRNTRGGRRRGMNKPISAGGMQFHAINTMGRILSLRANASPFTLITDDLNQRAIPLVAEIVRRAFSRNINIVYVTFERGQLHSAVRHVAAHVMTTGDQVMQGIKLAMSPANESVVIVDSMQDLLSLKDFDMNELFDVVVNKFGSNLIGVYHKDLLATPNIENPYTPSALDLLKYMAMTIINCKSFSHALAAKAAKERSLPEPTYGLLQGAEGIVQSLDANSIDGIVLETEFRRTSGRISNETYWLRAPRHDDYHNISDMDYVVGVLKKEFVTLLKNHPEYSSRDVINQVEAAAGDLPSTFNLGLTDKQKQAREGVVLPYFDAQKGEGGEGGRILYDMGAEDDFDEEEDEI